MLVMQPELFLITALLLSVAFTLISHGNQGKNGCAAAI